jgi:hypothetical protein
MPRADKPVARLGWLLDGEFTYERGAGPNRLAADELVGVLRGDDTISTHHAALVTGFAMLAEAVDADPTNAALWGQYRQAEVAVRSLMESNNDPLADLLAELNGAGDADVRNAAQPESPNAWHADRTGGEVAGSAADAASGADRRRRRGTTA